MFKTKKILVIFMLLGGLQSTHSAQPATDFLTVLARRLLSVNTSVTTLLGGGTAAGIAQGRHARALQEEIERRQEEAQEQIARLQAELADNQPEAPRAQPTAPRAQASRRLPVAQQPSANKLFDKEAFLQSMNLELIKTGVELNARIEHLNTLIEHLRREITKLDTRLQQDTQRYLAEINELQRLYDAIHDLLKRTVTRYKREMSILKKQIKTQNQYHKQTIARLELEIKSINKTNEKTDQEKDAKLKKLHDDLLAKLAAAEKRAHTAEVQVAQMQDDMDALQRDLPGVIDESLESFVQKLQALQAKLEATEEILGQEVEKRVAAELETVTAKKAGMGLFKAMQERAERAERQLAELRNALFNTNVSV